MHPSVRLSAACLTAPTPSSRVEKPISSTGRRTTRPSHRVAAWSTKLSRRQPSAQKNTTEMALGVHRVRDPAPTTSDGLTGDIALH